MTRTAILIILLSVVSLTTMTAAPNGRNGRPYTEADPLVMACDMDFAPYEFINSSGDPDGYNIEMMDIILNRLGIPHRFEMREWKKAFEMFEHQEADIIHAIGSLFNDPPYLKTKTLIHQYKIKVAYRNDTPPLTSLAQLENTDTIVMKANDYAASYMYGLDYRPYYIRFELPREGLIKLIHGEIKYYIWGSTPLEQKIKELALDNVELCDIDIPAGELQIIGYDQRLINAIDDEYARMSQAGELEVLRDKWFHPERIHDNAPRYVFFIIGCVLLLTIGLIFLNRLIRKRIKKAVNRTKDLGSMMTQALSMGDFYVFEHDLSTGRMKNVYGNLLPSEGIDVEDFFSFIHPSDINNAQSVYNTLLRDTKCPINLQLRWKGRILKGNSIAETDGNKLTHIVNIVKDITREVEEEEANKELGSIYVNIFQSNMIAMSFYDADGMLIDLNQSMRTLCEFDDQREAFFRKTCMFDTPILKNDFDRNNKHSFHVCQHMYYPEIGLDKYLDFRIRPTLNEQEHIMYYIVTARDVTAERQTDLELRQQEKGLKKISQENSHYEHELRYLLENSNMYVWTLDAKDQQIVFTRSLTKPEYKENFEEYIKSLFDDEQQAAFESLKGFFTKPQPFSVVHHFKHTPEDKWPQWHAISGMPTFNEEGQCIGYFGVLRNIDDLMNAHEQLRKERTRAEASGLMKSAFLANMTHEIRTPLNAIVGFSDLLQIIEEPEDRQEFIRIIRNNCDMLLRLINDILEASNTSQTLSVSPTKVDFAQVFDDICQTLEQRVQEPNVAFLKDNPFDTYPTQLDKGRIQQVVTNFVTNAVKYTHEGHIKVGYREQDGGLYIYCEDTGSGIPKDKQASVFERFVKLNDFVQGTGLGLSICKTIAEKCNGKIGVFSEGEGKGSTFWLWIPCKKE